MANKTKNQKSTIDSLNIAAGNVGLMLMAASATLLAVELPENKHPKVVVPNQPVFAVAENVSQPGHDTQQRRERDEVHPHYHSYGVNQRTPARSGRV